VSVEVVVPAPAGTLAGTLTLPRHGRPPFPAVVTLAGSGPHFRDGNLTDEPDYRPFRQIAEHLAQRGIAALRLDGRGVGGSTGDANAATAEDTAADARAALQFLRSRADIDARRLGLVGHSYGGEIAPMVAAEEPGLAAVVLLAGPARTFRETSRYQLRYRIERDASIPARDREAVLADAMRQQEKKVEASAEAWRRSIQDRDPLPTARRLRMPVLVLQGLADRAVDPGDARLLEHAIREGGNRRVEVRLFPGVNHQFQRVPVVEGDAPPRTQDLAPEVLDALCSWLRATLARR
jgi:hypothetical protein